MHFYVRMCAVLALAVFTALSSAFSYVPPFPQWPMPPYAPLIPNGRRGMNPPEEFGVYFSLWAESAPLFNLNAGNVPFRQDVILVSAGSVALYPRQGPHMIERYPGGREAFYANYLQQLTTYINGIVFVPGYDGMLVLDYEWFCPWWTGHFNWTSYQGPEALDMDPIDDWRDTLWSTRAATLSGMTPAQQQEYFKQEWLATTREFFTRTIDAARAACPTAKIGVYNMPSQTYWDYRDPAAAFRLRAGHDEVPWFWDMVDVILPSVYPFYMSVPDERTVVPGTGIDHEWEFDLYVRSNISEAIRVARGKPVYVYVSYIYHASNTVYPNQPCNDFNLRRPFELAREMGCNGAVLWGWIRNQQEYDAQAPYFNNVVIPYLEQFTSLPALPIPPSPCTADVGSQGGSTLADSVLDQNDFVAFVDLFFTWNARADVGRQGGLHGPDGLLNSNDFVAFIDQFMSGCP